MRFNLLQFLHHLCGESDYRAEIESLREAHILQSSKPLDLLLQQEVEASPVSVIEEDGLPCVATQGNMIERSRTVNSWLTGHGSMLNNKLQLCKPDPLSTDPLSTPLQRTLCMNVPLASAGQPASLPRRFIHKRYYPNRSTQIPIPINSKPITLALTPVK